MFKDSLFYEGTVQPIHPPDIYGVLIKNERGNRPHIYSREEILKEVVCIYILYDNQSAKCNTYSMRYNIKMKYV